MLVSDKEKFIFFHVPKAGGTSIHIKLKERYGWTDDPPPVLHHMKAKDYLEFFPKKAEYFKFAIVRNPFDRLVSAWCDFTQNRLVGRIQNNYKTFLENKGLWEDDTLCIYRMWETNPKQFESYDDFCAYYRQAYDWNVDGQSLEYFDILDDVGGGEFLTIKKDKGFDYFCEHFVDSGWSRDIHFLPQTDVIGDIPDYIGRVETIENDMEYISHRLGFDLTIGHDRKSNHRHYREMYTPKTRKIIEEHFAKDLETYGYEF